MDAGRLMAIACVGLLVGGCAAKRQGQTLGRLQSQVGLLDERLTRLEQSSVGWGAGPVAVAEPSLPPSPSPAPSVAASSAAPSTRQLQQALANAGFYRGAIDGKRGPLTRQAIEEFQRVNGLTVDGKVGPKTWGKLHAYLGSDQGEPGGGPIAALK